MDATPSRRQDHRTLCRKVITRAKVNDWELYKKIRLETLKQEPNAFSSKYEDALLYSDDFWKKLLRDRKTIFLFAKKSNEVIGVIRVTFNDSEEPPDTALIGGAYVKKEYRRLGIGNQLLDTLLKLTAAKKNIKTIRLYVKESQIPAIMLYKHAGFKTIGMKDGEIVMEKENTI